MKSQSQRQQPIRNLLVKKQDSKEDCYWFTEQNREK